MLNKPDFAEERDKLRSKCVYMADDDFLNRVEWFNLQGLDRVVTLEEAERFEEQAAAALSQDSLEELEVLPPRPAVLAAIVQLKPRDGFYMSPCTGWTLATPSRGGPKFPECRASALAVAPRNIPEIEGDYETGMNQMIELCNRCSPGPQVVGLFERDRPQQGSFKIGQRIFEVRTSPLDLYFTCRLTNGSFVEKIG